MTRTYDTARKHYGFCPDFSAVRTHLLRSWEWVLWDTTYYNRWLHSSGLDSIGSDWIGLDPPGLRSNPLRSSWIFFNPLRSPVRGDRVSGSRSRFGIEPREARREERASQKKILTGFVFYVEYILANSNSRKASPQKHGDGKNFQISSLLNGEFYLDLNRHLMTFWGFSRRSVLELTFPGKN